MTALVLLLLAYFGAGFTLKMGDDLLDDYCHPSYAWLPFAVSGALFGFLMTESEWDLLLFSAIIIGVLLSGKVNRPQFSIGFIMIGIMLFVKGMPVITYWPLWLWILGVLLVSSIADELGNNWSDTAESVPVAAFFKYRFTMKLTVLILSILWPEFWGAALGLWSFDVGYEVASILARMQFHEKY